MGEAAYLILRSMLDRRSPSSRGGIGRCSASPHSEELKAERGRFARPSAVPARWLSDIPRHARCQSPLLLPQFNCTARNYTIARIGVEDHGRTRDGHSPQLLAVGGVYLNGEAHRPGRVTLISACLVDSHRLSEYTVPAPASVENPLGRYQRVREQHL